MYISRPKATPYTIAEIATNLQVSQNHLVKVVHFMGKQQWIITSRGKGGGIQLNPDALTLQLGQVVRILQGDQPIVECNHPPCVLRVGCGLKGVLDQALDQFYAHLDQFSLQQAIQNTAQTSQNLSYIPILSIEA